MGPCSFTGKYTWFFQRRYHFCIKQKQIHFAKMFQRGNTTDIGVILASVHAMRTWMPERCGVWECHYGEDTHVVASRRMQNCDSLCYLYCHEDIKRVKLPMLKRMAFFTVSLVYSKSVHDGDFACLPISR